MANADPEARRVIVGTYVVPTYTIEGEETAITHTEFQTSPGKALGGKGSVIINKDQWDEDKWTSMEHVGLSLWEDFTTVNFEDFTSNWEDAPRGSVTVEQGSPIALSTSSDPLLFLYIRNTNLNKRYNNALVSTDSGGSYFIVIPPDGAVHFRGDGTLLLCNEIYVQANDTTTTIEYVIAK